MSDFYVGSSPNAPHALAGFIRRTILLTGLLAVIVALALLTGQMPFANSVFEFGTIRTLEGVIRTTPYPMLLVARPGETVDAAQSSRYLLVAPGKHGADAIVAGLDGKTVSLQGQLIYREGGTMVEVVPGSIKVSTGSSADSEMMSDLGPRIVNGEIVDSKCYLGVMNPGQGKVHRDCAARCLSGGIPPLFISIDGREKYLLVGPDGYALAPDALRAFVAEPLTLAGELFQAGDSRILRIDPQKLRHTTEFAQVAQK